MFLQGFLLCPPVSRDELMPAMANLAQRAQELLITSQPVRGPAVLESVPPVRKLSPRASQ